VLYIHVAADYGNNPRNLIWDHTSFIVPVQKDMLTPEVLVGDLANLMMEDQTMTGSFTANTPNVPPFKLCCETCKSTNIVLKSTTEIDCMACKAPRAVYKMPFVTGELQVDNSDSILMKNVEASGDEVLNMYGPDIATLSSAQTARRLREVVNGHFLVKFGTQIVKFQHITDAAGCAKRLCYDSE
jgi:hypothetical protein